MKRRDDSHRAPSERPQNAAERRSYDEGRVDVFTYPPSGMRVSTRVGLRDFVEPDLVGEVR